MAHDVHCWFSPPSVQLGDVLMLIRDRMRGRSGGVVPTSPSQQFSGPYEERGLMYNDSLFNAFARSFEARSETDMSMQEYLESCRGDPMRYANAAERLLAAIGEPQMIDTAKDARLGRIFFEQDHARLSSLRRILWHGRNDRAHRRVLPARGARSGRAQADSLSAGAGGRWKIVAGGAAEIVDGSPSHLRAEGRRRTQSGVREPPEFVRSGIAGADD